MVNLEDNIHHNKSFEMILFTERKIQYREFDRCTFLNCNFTNSIFLETIFTDCSFIDCNLSMTKFNHSQMDAITFKGCKILGVNFSSCSDFLFSVKFDSCILDCCSFNRKKLHNTPFINSSVKDVDFTDCDLSNSLFHNTDLSKTTFKNTNLKAVNFLTAKNYTIKIEMNTIKKAKFSLDGIVGLVSHFDIIIE